ncbi:HprK-related kinase A [Colwelliaceae bacterium 6441]
MNLGSNFELKIPVGPFTFKIISQIPSLTEELKKLYGDYEQITTDEFYDFCVEVKPSKGLRRWIKPTVDFYFDEHKKPFKPLPASQCYPMLEWGMNWCIASHAHQYFIMHSAAIALNGKGILMPAPQGSGKSTLCAAMVNSGWQLFSDELGLIEPTTLNMVACTRPINLKNDSIDIIKSFRPDTSFSEKAYDTQKGTVALLKPPKTSVQKMQQPAKLTAIVFPKYVKGSSCNLTQIPQYDAFHLLIDNSFNYHVLGQKGFETVGKMLHSSNCYTLEYSDFDEANQCLTQLINE